MVDAVITWVDGSDPIHRKKRAYYYNLKEFENDDPKANEETRFSDNNEIWYCINSIRKFAYFIDKIFLVTDNQKPFWLNKKLQEDFNIKIIDHKVLFAGYEDYLPTFNSQTIESMIYRIPEIAERFIYFNDDVILVNTVTESEYFDHGKLLFRGDWQWKVTIKQGLAFYLPLDETFILKRISRGFVGYRNEAEYFKKNKFRMFKLAHTIHPILKYLWEEIFSDEEFLKQQLQYRFRNKRQYWPFSLAANIAMQSGLARKGPNDYAYLSGSDLNLKQTKKWLDFLDKNKHIKSVCIQSLDKTSSEIEDMIKAYLDDRVIIASMPGG